MLSNDILSAPFFIVMLKMIMLSVAFFYCYPECRYAECHGFLALVSVVVPFDTT
jgi:hypothetical protein